MTTRVRSLLPGYIEVPLGLLSEPEAVKLLLGTAGMRATTESEMAASKTLVKLAGYLPLFIGMVGRLLVEFGGPGSDWETELARLVALLEEDKEAVLGGDGMLSSAKIVGSSLSQVKTPEAKELFSAMAIVAEDVPVPLAALELIWCAWTSATPPIGRDGMMNLRTSCFQVRLFPLLNAPAPTLVHTLCTPHRKPLTQGCAPHASIAPGPQSAARGNC